MVDSAKEYLRPATQLLFAACNSNDKGYDPLSYDLDDPSPIQASLIMTNSFIVEQGKLAQIAVQKEKWAGQGITDSYDYLKHLFGENDLTLTRTSARRRRNSCESSAHKLEADLRKVKKARLRSAGTISQDSESSGNHSTSYYSTSQHHTVETPPPTENCENPLSSEEDLYTPRWLTGYRGKGWCGLCTPGRWLSMDQEWFNDRCLFHGICPTTKRRFAEPKTYTILSHGRRNGQCGKCNSWIIYRPHDERHYSAWNIHAMEVS
ncbi:hypothetical protein NHQ30_001238 [Ciborinia camelliae]|nr:hypothetical protein NHQ30_001238 [Ciborinia camelliae]